MSILKLLHKSLREHTKTTTCGKNEQLFSLFISAYRELCKMQHVLITLIEEWRKNLDNNEFIRAVLMDLLKVFHCIPHDLIIAKLAAYRYYKSMMCYIYSYLKSRMCQCKQY